MVVDHGLDFGVGHDGEDALGDAVHVAVGTLETERGLGAVGVLHRGGADVFEIDPEDGVADAEEFGHDGDHFLDLLGGVVAGEIDSLGRAGLGDADDGMDVGAVAGGETGEDGIGGEAVLDVAGLEVGPVLADDVAKVVGVGPVREHVGDLELATTLGVGVPSHDDRDFLPCRS